MSTRGAIDRMPFGGPTLSGSGNGYTLPSCTSRSPAAIVRTICGPLVPRPRRKRPPDIAWSDIADMASIAGVRAPTWAMPEASRKWLAMIMVMTPHR
jgi:hypothetical protein